MTLAKVDSETQTECATRFQLFRKIANPKCFGNIQKGWSLGHVIFKQWDSNSSLVHYFTSSRESIEVQYLVYLAKHGEDEVFQASKDSLLLVNRSQIKGKTESISLAVPYCTTTRFKKVLLVLQRYSVGNKLVEIISQRTLVQTI